MKDLLIMLIPPVLAAVLGFPTIYLLDALGFFSDMTDIGGVATGYLVAIAYLILGFYIQGRLT